MSNSAPIATQVYQILQGLQPSYVLLENESNRHAGYFEGKESHFKLTIVSEQFVGKRLIQRHQHIYQLVADFLTQNGGQIHALAIHAYAPDEWQGQSPNSPNCAGQH